MIASLILALSIHANLTLAQEIQAECIAVMLRHHPRREWKRLAEKYAKLTDPCHEAFKPEHGRSFPMKGKDWQDRLNQSREVVK